MNLSTMKSFVDDLKKYKKDSAKDTIEFEKADGDGMAMMKAHENRLADKHFSICHTDLLKGMQFVGGPTATHRLNLDDEDIEYFIDKYSKIYTTMADTEEQYQKDLKALNDKYKRHV